MSLSQPISVGRALRLIIGVGFRRWQSQLRMRLRFGKKKKPTPVGPRTGTARRSAGGSLLLAFLSLAFLWQGWTMSVPIVRKAILSGSDGHEYSRFIQRKATHFAENWDTLTDAEKEEAVHSLATEVRIQSLERAGKDPSRESEGETHWLRESRELIDLVRQSGEDAIITASPISVAGLGRLVPADAHGSIVGLRLRFALFLAFMFIVSMSIGHATVDLAKPEWDLEWLWTTPAPSAAILWSRFLEYALLNPLAWITGGMLSFTILQLRLGVLGSAGIAIVTAIYLSVIAASVRMVVEFSLRGRLRVAKNIQALASILGVAGFFCLILAGNTDAIPSWFDQAAAWLAPLGHVVAIPIWVLNGPGAGIAGLGAALLVAVAAAFGTVAFASRQTLGGLVNRSSVHEGRRGAPTPSTRGDFLRGLVGKDIRLVLRDRNVLVQIILVPALVFGMQLVVNKGMVNSILNSPRAAAAAAYGIGAYMLMFCATGVLSGEAGALWILYASPHRIDSLLRKKTALWATLGTAYALVVGLSLAVTSSPENRGELLIRLGSVAIGVAMCGYVAAAVGSLGADPANPEPTRRVTPWAMYAYMLLSGMLGSAVFAPNWWSALTTFVFMGLLTVALWQHLRDRIPYLLDPTEAPRPRVSFAHGMGAAFAFLVLSGIIASLFAMREGLSGVELLISYSIAGVVVTVLSAVIIGRRVSDFAITTGLRRGTSTAGALPSIGMGLVGGLLAASAGVLYLRLIAWFPWIREALQAVDSREGSLSASDINAFVGLAVVAAPLVEEFVFRGLAFRGLERSMRPTFAVLTSAALFAFVHPLISVPPVFVLGVVAAFVFRRSGLLIAPIVCHAVYNAIVVADQVLFS